MNEGFGLADRLVVAVYAALLLAFALRRRLQGGADDAAQYLVAGRAVTLPAFVANLVATWYGGILGVGEYAYRHGVSNWIVFGVPYYVAALIFALFLAPHARRARVLTIPEQLASAYGRGAGFLGALVVLAVTIPGAYALMAGTILSEILGLPLAVAVVLVTVLSISYLFFGGMRAIIAADRFYFVLMYSTFAFMVIWLVTKFGGMEFLRANLPAESFTWNGGRSFQAIAVWYVIALATLVEPSFYEACFSAQSQRTARVGILVSIAFWALFDFMTTTTGLYARALLPDLADPSRAFPLLAEQVLPPILRGVFFIGMLAVVMSTLDSYLFLSAQTLGRDLAWRWHAGQHSNRWVRGALLVTAAGAIALALSGLGVIEIWHHLGSIGTPALVVPMLASFDPRLRPSPRVAIAIMLAGAGVATLWLATATGEHYWLGLEPIFPALAVSLLLWGGSLAMRRAAA